MSEDNEEVDDTCCCASCGIAEIDDVKLKDCDDCDLVKYCSDECMGDHKSDHEEECKKREAELRDEILFKQPDSTHKGDCPICCLPIPPGEKKSVIHSCCSKYICNGCALANARREMELRLTHSCPFCREPTYITDEENDKQILKRVEANDPFAMRIEGWKQYKKGDYRKAFEYLSKAADLGNAEAHNNLSIMYHEGGGVEKDEGKYIHHIEEAAIGGHPVARYMLGLTEMDNGNDERAVKHWVIAATQGEDDAIKDLMDMFRSGDVSKEILTAALRAYQTAVNATKSPQRQAAEEYLEETGY